MKTITVWFNHWFSTSYHIINLIKDDNDINIKILGTNSNGDSVIKKVCDYWETEPDNLSDEEYIKYCIEMCEKYSVDIFVPRRKQLLICKNLEIFKRKNIEIFAENDYRKIKILSNKISAYKLFEKLKIGYIPEYRQVFSYKEFIEGYHELKKKYKKVCMKLAEDEGAQSFKLISEDTNKRERIFKRKSSEITLNEIKESFELLPIIPEIILMPYLEGNEVSVDCLKTKNGNIIIPRFKTSGRMEIVKYEEEIISVCNEFIEKFILEYPFNIQFRYHENKLYLLEINTRMSGGIQYSCEASGVNIPNITLNKILGKDKLWNIQGEEIRISFIETPVLL